jgi:sensor histidine kinase YesM
MLSQKTDAAADYVIKFSKLMRQILEHTRNEFVDLAAELEILRMYLDLEKERSSHRFHYVLNIEDSVDLHEALLPPMLIQPFVENAIWHGLIPSQGTKGQIQIDIYRESETLLCTVEDNGVGLNEDFSLDKLQKDSHGIQLVLDRINLLNEKSRAKGSVSLENTQSGVRVKLVIPLV